MKFVGCFEGLKGLFLGSFEAFGKRDDIFRIFQEVFKKIDIPILSGFEIGHSRINITIPMGLRATLNTNRRVLTFHEPATVTANE